MTLHSVCVYCGSSGHVDAIYKDTARTVGAALAQNGLQVIYGGGHVGLMGLMADAALQAGGKVTGIIPEHIRSREVQHTGLSELIVVDDMHTRKSLMAEKADAFVVLPGGFGTLDETFEILTWKQLGLHTKPVVFFECNQFWQPALRLIDHLVTTGFAMPDNRLIFKVVSDTAALMEALNAPAGFCCDPQEKWRST